MRSHISSISIDIDSTNGRRNNCRRRAHTHTHTKKEMEIDDGRVGEWALRESVRAENESKMRLRNWWARMGKCDDESMRQSTPNTNKTRRKKNEEHARKSDTEWVYNVKIMLRKRREQRRRMAKSAMAMRGKKLRCRWRQPTTRRSTKETERDRANERRNEPTKCRTRWNGMLLIEIQVENSIGICRNGIKKDVLIYEKEFTFQYKCKSAKLFINFDATYTLCTFFYLYMSSCERSKRSSHSLIPSH